MKETMTASLKRITSTALITGIGLAAAACGSAAAPASPAAHTAAPAPAAAAAPPAPLACGVHVSRHAVAGTLTGVRVRSAPHSQIAAAAHYASGVQRQGARAGAGGRHTFSYPAGTGHRVIVDIHVSLQGRKGACETSFRARKPAPPPMIVPAPAPTMAAPTPTPSMM
jgi:hypothetical protein